MKNVKNIVLGFLASLVVLLGGYTAGDKLGAGRLNYMERTMLDEVVATTVSSAFNVADFVHVGFTVANTGATGTLKFACSMQETAPTFSSTQSVTNRWDYVEIIDLEDGTSIAGDTGIVTTGSTDVRQFELNTNNLRWCSAIWTRTSGTSTVKLLGAMNN